MTVSATEFKTRCLELLRRSEVDRETILVTRHGRVVARLVPAGVAERGAAPPWQRLRGSGRLHAAPDESVIAESDFHAAR